MEKQKLNPANVFTEIVDNLIQQKNEAYQRGEITEEERISFYQDLRDYLNEALEKLE